MLEDKEKAYSYFVYENFKKMNYRSFYCFYNLQKRNYVNSDGQMDNTIEIVNEIDSGILKRINI